MALVGQLTTDTTNTAMLSNIIKADVSTISELIGGLSAIANSATSGHLVLSEVQRNMLQKMEAKLVLIVAMYTAAVRIHNFLNVEISSRLSNLSIILEWLIRMFEDVLRNHGAVGDGGGRPHCTLILSGWVTHMRRWVEDTEKALNVYVREQHTRFTILEKQIKGLSDHYVRETGSECDQPQRILFALENSFLNADHDIVYPEIRPAPLCFGAHEYENWPKEERAVAIESAKILGASLEAFTLTD